MAGLATSAFSPRPTHSTRAAAAALAKAATYKSFCGRAGAETNLPLAARFRARESARSREESVSPNLDSLNIACAARLTAKS